MKCLYWKVDKDELGIIPDANKKPRFFLTPLSKPDEARFFPEKGTHFGVYYYPEHWSEDQWERECKSRDDFDREPWRLHSYCLRH